MTAIPSPGAGSSTVTIRGDRFQLSDDAVAKVDRRRAEASPTTDRSGTVSTNWFRPRISSSASGEAADQQIVGGGVLGGRRGDIVDFRLDRP